MKNNPSLLSILSILSIFCVIGCSKNLDLVNEIIGPPTKVNLVYPENNGICTTGTAINELISEVEFDWSDAAIGNRYQVNLTNLITNEQTTYPSEDSSINIELLKGTPYQWSVVTYLDETAENIESDTAVFYNSAEQITSYVPFPANAITPRNGQEVHTATITLLWKVTDIDDDVVSNAVYFGPNENPELYSQTTATLIENIQVENNTEYYWYVVSTDANDNSSKSNTFFFSVNF